MKIKMTIASVKQKYMSVTIKELSELLNGSHLKDTTVSIISPENTEDVNFLTSIQKLIYCMPNITFFEDNDGIWSFLLCNECEICSYLEVFSEIHASEREIRKALMSIVYQMVNDFSGKYYDYKGNIYILSHIDTFNYVLVDTKNKTSKGFSTFMGALYVIQHDSY